MRSSFLRPSPERTPLTRVHSNFLTRTATDTVHELDRDYSTFNAPEATQQEALASSLTRHNNAGASTDAPAPSDKPNNNGIRPSPAHEATDDKNIHDKVKKLRSGTVPRPIGGSAKLGTFNGVFVPTTLNVLSILMFLRFGFILGQSGVLGMMGMLIVCYLVNLVTTMSISAIATNGTVRGGGAYYLISRSLGPEFGGSIGIVSYLGFVLNTGMNAVGLVDCFALAFGSERGKLYQFLNEGYWWQYLWATIILLICTGICLAGSSLFARCSNGLLVILLIATFSIPISTLFVNPFNNLASSIEYTGPRVETFKGNIKPQFTRHAAGSQILGRENYQDLFGVLFPATGGIFAGASMSGDLKHPSRAIPKGTLYGLALTFCTYTLVILAMAASITRDTFYHNVNIIQDVNISATLILLGEFATSFFSCLMGVIGSAKLLQALARDHLVPGLSLFGQGTEANDEPTYAILITYAVSQLTMLFNINQIASFVTMTYLMTFLVTNLACFLLKISSAPNFRPSFNYFNSWTAAIGTLASGVIMFIVDGLYASGCVGILIAIFLVIHYTTPPKSWGDVSQSLVYHQVRKYLLRLKHEHVKYWRPQILLFVNDPRRSYKLIQFCNSLKKGALFILGHVIVTQDFGDAVPEARRQQDAWTKYIDFSRIKAFVNVAISPGVEWGARNVVLSAGLGGMRPNIVIMGFYNLTEYRLSQPLLDVPPLVPSPPSTTHRNLKRRRSRSKTDALRGQLPTDTNRPEMAVGAKNYVTILEDLLLRLQVNVAIAKGFNELELPVQASRTEGFFSFLHMRESSHEENIKKYIDLWPIQMSAEITSQGDERKQNVLTTNFDTYTLILQLGCILNTVPAWKRAYKLRVIVFVEYESDVEEERSRVDNLLSSLRIKAETLVFHLASGTLQTYEIIVNGNYHGADVDAQQHVDGALQQEEWWHDLKAWREGEGLPDNNSEITPSTTRTSVWTDTVLQTNESKTKFTMLRKLNGRLRKRNRQPSIGNISRLGVNLSMQTHRLDPDIVSNHPTQGSASSSDEAESDSETQENTDGSEFEQASIFSGSDKARFNMDDGMANASSTPTGPPAIEHAAALQNSSIGSYFDTSRTKLSHSAEDTPQSTLVPPKVITQDEHKSSSTEMHQPLHFPRQKSHPSFSSNPVPRTTVTGNDGPGPSIMFSTPSPPRRENVSRLHQMPSIYAPPSREQQQQQQPSLPQSMSSKPSSGHGSPNRTILASGYPSGSSQSLCFNNLPCRAQHLILNELMRRESGGGNGTPRPSYLDSEATPLIVEDHHGSDTAVIFTTLPAPVEGTGESEEESLRYLGDLETLCEALPPVLMVHSNSMTVTVNL